MKQKIAVTLDKDLVAFLDAVASGNRSDYINSLLREQRKQIVEAELIAALNSDAVDPDYQAEIADWDSVVGDGIDLAAGGADAER
ncbi:type II toxin-antitoxin system MazE family antitoxin [Chroococcidiopsis sp.]|uniref:type II toxin-antitoxin system MazE family antitoxin n=1 Tax=Chroococcidiopsis sp. TaxID=3088168 RepID=UPI003F318FDC